MRNTQLSIPFYPIGSTKYYMPYDFVANSNGPQTYRSGVIESFTMTVDTEKYNELTNNGFMDNINGTSGTYDSCIWSTIQKYTINKQSYHPYELLNNETEVDYAMTYSNLGIAVNLVYGFGTLERSISGTNINIWVPGTRVYYFPTPLSDSSLLSMYVQSDNYREWSLPSQGFVTSVSIIGNESGIDVTYTVKNATNDLSDVVKFVNYYQNNQNMNAFN